LAWATPGAVLAQWAALRFVGERWWITTLNLHIPFVLWLAPVGLSALALIVLGPRRLL
jgi:hypothetical protein